MRGRMQAVMAAVICTVLSVIFAPLGYLGAAALALTTLRLGAKRGLEVILASALLVGLFLFFLKGEWRQTAELVGMLWLPVWLIAMLLRFTASQGVALGAAGVIGIISLLVTYLLLAAPIPGIPELLSKTMVPILEQQGIVLDKAMLSQMAMMMTRLSVALSVLMGIIASILLARWWQALLYNPGEFAKEFRLLRLNRGFAIAVLVLLASLLIAGPHMGTIGPELLTLALVLYMVQGLSVAHSLVALRRVSAGWLFAMYLLLVFLWPWAMTLLGAAGFVDAWVDFRRRLGAT